MEFSPESKSVTLTELARAVIIKTLKSVLGTKLIAMQGEVLGHMHKRNSQKGYAKGYNDIHSIKGHLCACRLHCFRFLGCDGERTLYDYCFTAVYEGDSIDSIRKLLTPLIQNCDDHETKFNVEHKVLLS